MQVDVDDLELTFNSRASGRSSNREQSSSGEICGSFFVDEKQLILKRRKIHLEKNQTKPLFKKARQ